MSVLNNKWVKNGQGWSREEYKNNFKENSVRSISILFLLDNDVLVKVGESLKEIINQKSKSFHETNNEKQRIEYGEFQYSFLKKYKENYWKQESEKHYRMLQDIHMYGICHSLFNCPIKEISERFKWTRTYSIPRFWSQWLSIVEGIRGLGEEFQTDIISFARRHFNRGIICHWLYWGWKKDTSLSPTWYNTIIGVSRISSACGKKTICIRNISSQGIQPEHLLEFKTYDASIFRNIPMNTIYR